uniref:Uncharacterized protein n=1 Tax=Alexandrium monilatum TaxID=311494 RepID=A0A7S4VM73_9DINO
MALPKPEADRARARMSSARSQRPPLSQQLAAMLQVAPSGGGTGWPRGQAASSSSQRPRSQREPRSQALAAALRLAASGATRAARMESTSPRLRHQRAATACAEIRAL